MRLPVSRISHWPSPWTAKAHHGLNHHHHYQHFSLSHRHITLRSPSSRLMVRQDPNYIPRRTIRTIPVNKVKHIRRSRFNISPELPILGATPAAAYKRRLDADSIPLRSGVLAVKRGMTAVYVDASGIRFEREPDADHDAQHGAAPIDAANGSSKKTVAGGKPMEGGQRIPATVLQMDRVQVIANKTREKHGYYAVVVGEGWRKPKNVGKAMLGVFSRARLGETLPPGSSVRLSKRMDKEAQADAATSGDTKEGENEAPPSEDQDPSSSTASPSSPSAHIGLPPKREVREFKVRDLSGLLPVGTYLTASWFQVGQFVDARGTARGMGFAGVMKRHGFKGQPASHGVSLTHRSMGSAGGGQGSGSRVHPGKRMAGKMGGQRHTVQSLKVLMVDPENGLVVVTGAVSGRKGDLVMLSDAIRKPWPDPSFKPV